MNKSQPAPLDARHQKLNAQMRSMEVAQWKYLVSRINEPTTARVIVDYLDSNSTQKARCAGIYLRASDTVQRSRVRYEKAFKWGQRWTRFLAWISRSGTKAATTASPTQTENRIRKEAPVPDLVWPDLNWS